MQFFRIGNGQNLLVLHGPHDIIGNPNQSRWALKRWSSRIDGLVVGGVSAGTLPRREYGAAGIVQPIGTLGVVVAWNDEKNRAEEVLLLSTMEGTSFYYKDVVVSMQREVVRVSGFGQEWCFEVGHDPVTPSRVTYFFAPSGVHESFRSLEDLRIAMQRRKSGGFIDRRGTGTSL